MKTVTINIESLARHLINAGGLSEGFDLGNAWDSGWTNLIVDSLEDALGFEKDLRKEVDYQLETTLEKWFWCDICGSYVSETVVDYHNRHVGCGGNCQPSLA